jgi:hypothetical protein
MQSFAQENIISSNLLPPVKDTYKAFDISTVTLPFVSLDNELSHCRVDLLFGFNKRIWVVISPDVNCKDASITLQIERIATSIKTNFLPEVGDTQLYWFCFDPFMAHADSATRLFSITRLDSKFHKTTSNCLRSADQRELEYINDNIDHSVY